MYFTKQVEFEKNIAQKHTKKLKDSLLVLTNKCQEADHFSLEFNDKAMEYFDSYNLDEDKKYEKLIPYVNDKLLDFNTQKDGNPYAGQETLNGEKFIINKSKVLNHRWIIAEYSNGDYWGEVLLKYFVNEDQTISFEVIQSVLYQK